MTNAMLLAVYFLYIKKMLYICDMKYNNMEKEVLINRKQTAFRLREDLLNKIKEEAKKENRSINNYVETILLDVIYREPNETTLEAIREAKQGKLAGTIDTTDMETLIQSVSEWKSYIIALNYGKTLKNTGINLKSWNHINLPANTRDAWNVI